MKLYSSKKDQTMTTTRTRNEILVENFELSQKQVTILTRQLKRSKNETEDFKTRLYILEMDTKEKETELTLEIAALKNQVTVQKTEIEKERDGFAEYQEREVELKDQVARQKAAIDALTE